MPPQFTVKIELYKTDVVVRRQWETPRGAAQQAGTRGRIRGLSRASARRLLFTARNLPPLRTMVTLTYPGEFPLDGRKVKRDWDTMRRWFAHRGLGGLWFLEFQRRGAPHLHVYLNQRVPRSEIAATWYRIVGSGDVRHLRAGTRTDTVRSEHGLASYAAKYASKTEQKLVPEEYREVGRFWGAFGKVRVAPLAVVEGSGADIIAQTRLVRRLYVAHRRAQGLRKLRRDNGSCGWKAWGVSDSARKCLGRLKAPTDEDPAGAALGLS